MLRCCFPEEQSEVLLVVLIGWRLLNLCLMLLKCVCVFVFVRPAATGEVGPLLQRTPGVEPPLCASQLRSVLCPGSQEDRYCKFFLIISSFVPFLHTRRVIGLVLKKNVHFAGSLLCSHVLSADEGI